MSTVRVQVHLPASQEAWLEAIAALPVQWEVKRMATMEFDDEQTDAIRTVGTCRCPVVAYLAHHGAVALLPDDLQFVLNALGMNLRTLPEPTQRAMADLVVAADGRAEYAWEIDLRHRLELVTVRKAA